MNCFKLKNRLKKNKTIMSIYQKYKKYKGQFYNELIPILIKKEELMAKKNFYQEIIDNLQKELENNKTKWVNYPKLEKIEKFSILSFNGDTLGKVFMYNNKIYRGIYKQSIPYFIKLWESGIFQTLMKNNYIPQFHIAPYFANEYPIILEIEKLKITNMDIWSYSMLKDACIHMAIIEMFLKKNGYTLIDGHLNNITFRNNKPIFFDIGSFISKSENSFNEELIFTGCYRMLFENLGNCILARFYPFDPHNNSIWISPRNYNFFSKEYQYCLKEYKKYHKSHSSRTSNEIIKEIFDDNCVKPEYIDLLFHYNYNEKKELQSINQINNIITNKVLEIINNNKYNISSYLSIGGTNFDFLDKCNAKINSKNGIFLEYNEIKCDILYQYIKKNNYRNSIFMYNYLYESSKENMNALTSDLIITFDIYNNNKIYQYFKMDAALNSIKKLCNKYSIVTFDDKSGDLENFTRIWESFFNTLIKDSLIVNDKKIYFFFGEIK